MSEQLTPMNDPALQAGIEEDRAAMAEARRRDALDAAIKNLRTPGFEDYQQFEQLQKAKADTGKMILDIPGNAVVGLYDAVRNTAETALDVGKAVAEGQGDLATVQGGGTPPRQHAPPVDLKDIAPEFIAEADRFRAMVTAQDTPLDTFEQKTFQFMLPFMATMKLMGAGTAAADIGKGIAADAMVSGTVWEPHEARFADLLQELDPTGVLNNAAIDYLASNPEDSDAEARFKNILDGQLAAGIIAIPVAGLQGLVRASAATLRSARNGVLFTGMQPGSRASQRGAADAGKAAQPRDAQGRFKKADDNG